MSEAPATILDEPLPDAGSRVGYRGYPAFTRRWLAGRARAFGTVFAALGAIVAAGTAAQANPPPPWDMFRMVAAFVLGMPVMAFIGPTLATVIRHRRFPLRTERVLVVLAIVVGVVCAAMVDSYVSGVISEVLGAPAARTDPSVSFGLIGVLIYASLGGGLALRSYFTEPRRRDEQRRRRELDVLRRDKQALDTRLGVLQAQIEPHFLFNTLAAARSLVAQRPRDAERLLDALVAYLRATIPRLREAGVEHTLGEQMDLCRAYLDIMSLRLSRLTYRVEVPDGLRTHAFLPLVVLTLVENAIKHGIEPKKGSGSVEVLAAAEGTTLTIVVQDDGVGLGEGVGSGLGLRNVHEQLKLRFGDRARFELANVAGGGARATITVVEELG